MYSDREIDPQTYANSTAPSQKLESKITVANLGPRFGELQINNVNHVTDPYENIVYTLYQSKYMHTELFVTSKECQ